MKNREYLSEEIHWKGTPGVGDFMFGLNFAHVNAYFLNKPVKLVFNWYWNVKEQYHFEDPELTIERLDYIHQFYKDSDMVEVDHIYDSKDNEVYVNMTKSDSKYMILKSDASKYGYLNWWHFRKDFKLPIDKEKVVFFRDTFNADVVRKWKRLIDHKGWDKVIANLQINGYEPVELTYRTPIREALYHINTAAFVISYDGLWHYVTKNFHKPSIILSKSAITRLHTPEALTLDEKDIFHYSQNFSKEKKRDVIFQVNRVDRKIWGRGKRIRIIGDGLGQLRTRIKLYSDYYGKIFNSRQSSN